jgi:type I restriction enzyme, S subunit
MAVKQRTRDGYKMTQLGEIPAEWDIVNFKIVCNIVNGLVNPNEEPYNSYPHIGNANIEKFSGKLLNFNYAYEDNLISGKYLFNKNHVLYGKINPHFGKVAYPQFIGLCSADMYPIECNKDLLPIYLKYLLLDERFIKQMTAASARTGIPKVNRKELEMYYFILPPLNEQQKIAEILSTVDEQIENTHQLIERMKELKKGLMEQLLTKGIGHTKFKVTEFGEIPVEWEVKELASLKNDDDKYSYSGGPFGSDLTSKEYTDAGVQIIQLQNIGDGYFNDNYRIFTSDEKANELKKCNIYPGDLVIAKMAEPVARACIMPKKSARYLMASDAIRLSPNPVKVDGKFLMYAINSPYFRKQAVLNSTGTTRLRIGLTTLAKLKLFYPSLNEQQKIAEILSTLDEQIESYEQENEKYTEIKKGLMQQLLTGKIRVKL